MLDGTAFLGGGDKTKYNICSRFIDLNNSIVNEKKDFVIQQANQPITHNFTDMRQHTVTVEKETDLQRNQSINILDSISLNK